MESSPAADAGALMGMSCSRGEGAVECRTVTYGRTHNVDVQKGPSYQSLLPSKDHSQCVNIQLYCRVRTPHILFK